jgi:hypothetical protein
MSRKIEEHATVFALARDLRRVQRRFNLDVISATCILDQLGAITVRFTGVQTPIAEFENELGVRFCFEFADGDDDD